MYRPPSIVHFIPAAFIIYQSKARAGNITKLDAAVPWILLGGLAYPTFTTVFGCSYALGRSLYTSELGGIDLIGGVMMWLSYWGLTIAAIITGIKLLFTKG
jgi:hypothetical protein